MEAIAETERAVKSQKAEAGQYLTFMLGQETFAVSILPVREIIEYGGLTAIPMMPDFLRGVINVRGGVVPVIDLALCFRRSATEIGRRTCIIIVETASEDGRAAQRIGIIVDAVNEVIDVVEGDIEPPPSFGGGVPPEFIRGMAKRKNGFIIILDVNRVLSINEMEAIDRSLVSEAVGG
jgi:purine-binding chemotaxis protein CheW